MLQFSIMLDTGKSASQCGHGRACTKPKKEHSANNDLRMHLYRTLDFTWIYRPLEPGKTQADPMLSPTMAGGLFAVNREYW